MSNASSSVAYDVYSVVANPACIVYMKQKEISFTHLQWLEGISYNWLAYGGPVRKNQAYSDAGEFDSILIDDFDDGSDPNVLNGAIGTWNDSDRSGSSSVQVSYSDDDAGGMGGKCYEMSYDVRMLGDKKPGYAGVWMALNGLNANKSMYLTFMFKGAQGSESLRVGLKDMKSGEMKVPLKKYARSFQNWTMVMIPLEDFPGVDMANLENVSFSFSGTGKVYVDNLKFSGVKEPKRAFAISIGQLDSGAMYQYDEIDIPPYYEKKESFSSQETMVMLTFAREKLLAELNMPVGLNIKAIREKLHPNVSPSWALAFDAGVAHEFAVPWGNIAMGLVFQNMGYATPPVDVTDPMPFNIKVGIAALPREYAVAFDMDIDAPIDNKFKMSLGFEGWIADTLACRIGYAFGQDLGGLGVGLGFKVNSMNVDYALAPYSLFGNTHRLSVTYKFGKI